jgi:M6 family metalloprotease-like protein
MKNVKVEPLSGRFPHLAKNRAVCMIYYAVVCLSLCISALPSSGRSVYAAQADPPPPWFPWNVNGTQRLVVVCTEFSDVTHSTNVSTIRTRLENMATYFHNISFGKISIDFTLFGDEWLRLNNTMEYYGQGSGKNDLHGWDYIVDSIKAWERFVNFSEYECLTVIHAGEDQSSRPNQTELLWRQNYCNLGHTSKQSIRTSNGHYAFWGLAYDSEFEEWGLTAHEFGHSLGLPDLYVENRSLGIDNLSLMARGDRNGDPEGTCPAGLDAFSMYLLGWLNPVPVELNSTEDILEMNSSAHDSPTVYKVPLSNSEYYLLEVSERSGSDEYALSSTSLVAYIVDDIRESANGIVDVPNGGVVVQGGFYSDVARSVCVSFVSFNSSTHNARVGLSTQLFFVRVDIPDTIDCFSTITGKVQLFDGNNNPVRYAPLNITVDENTPIWKMTDENGKADFQLAFGPYELRNHTVRITSPSMLAGETEREIVVVFPWQPLAIVLLSIAFVVLAIKYPRRSAKGACFVALQISRHT